MSTQPAGISAAIDVVVAAVVGRVVEQMRAGDEARRAVGLGEVGERPHRVAHRRRVRLRDRDQLVVGVNRLRGLARLDRDRRQRRDQATRVEDAVDDREHVPVYRNQLEEAAEREQVVEAQGVVALERIPRRFHLEELLEPRRGRGATRRQARARSRSRRSCSRPPRPPGRAPRPAHRSIASRLLSGPWRCMPWVTSFRRSIPTPSCIPNARSSATW